MKLTIVCRRSFPETFRTVCCVDWDQQTSRHHTAPSPQLRLRHVNTSRRRCAECSRTWRGNYNSNDDKTTSSSDRITLLVNNNWVVAKEWKFIVAYWRPALRRSIRSRRDHLTDGQFYENRTNVRLSCRNKITSLQITWVKNFACHSCHSVWIVMASLFRTTLHIRWRWTLSLV